MLPFSVCLSSHLFFSLFLFPNYLCSFSFSMLLEEIRIVLFRSLRVSYKAVGFAL